MNTTWKIEHIYKTNVWIENGMCGERHVVVQHESCEPFTYCTFNYQYGYTDNSSTLAAARIMALSLGASEPIEYRSREIKWPTIDELRATVTEKSMIIFDHEMADYKGEVAELKAKLAAIESQQSLGDDTDKQLCGGEWV